MNGVIRRSDGKVAVICSGAVRWYRPAGMQWVNDDRWNKRCTAMADNIKPRRIMTDWERWFNSVAAGNRTRTLGYHMPAKKVSEIDWSQALFKSAEWLQIMCRMDDDKSRWTKWFSDTSSNMKKRERVKIWLLKHRI